MRLFLGIDKENVINCLWHRIPPCKYPLEVDRRHKAYMLALASPLTPPPTLGKKKLSVFPRDFSKDFPLFFAHSVIQEKAKNSPIFKGLPGKIIAAFYSI